MRDSYHTVIAHLLFSLFHKLNRNLCWLVAVHTRPQFMWNECANVHFFNVLARIFWSTHFLRKTRQSYVWFAASMLTCISKRKVSYIHHTSMLRVMHKLPSKHTFIILLTVTNNDCNDTPLEQYGFYVLLTIWEEDDNVEQISMIYTINVCYNGEIISDNGLIIWCLNITKNNVENH